ncbi:MAG: amidase [Phyllobacterium sp.]
MSDSMSAMPTLASLSADLQAGRRTSRQLIEECLFEIDHASKGARRAFVNVSRDASLAAADAIDRQRRNGARLSPYAGIPISIKDLFDIAGEVTTAGSRVLAEAMPALSDAPIVERLKRAGFILIGRANMTEFAYSGLGLNPHFGTPILDDRDMDSRIPGGSSSGAAVSVRLGMAHGAIGTDTGGSCRIPAAFCDLTGFKPTASRVPREGCVPLSSTLDSIGPIARSVDCCAVLEAIMAGEPARRLQERALFGMRLRVPETVVLDDLDEETARSFDLTLDHLAKAGAKIVFGTVPEFAEAHELNSSGGLAAIESFAWHRRLLETHADLYDPRILEFIQRGENISAADYIDLLNARQSLIGRANARLAGYDAIVMPTVPNCAPRISDLTDPDSYKRHNRLVLRNSFVVNMIDGCAISLPVRCLEPSRFSITVAGITGTDRSVLEVAQAVERQLDTQLLPRSVAATAH